MAATNTRPRISPAYFALALRLQEASIELSANDLRTRLQDCIADCYRGSGKWAYYIDHFGDSESGDVIFTCDGDCMRAPYSVTTDGAATKCVIDMESAVDVMPRTIYEEEADEEGHYAAMEESFRRNELYASLPVYERFISKKERDAASSDDFAGSGRSFPILKPEDVMAAARSIGRAGGKNKGPNAIKSAIIRIAKRKGWDKYLPKAWRDSDSTGKESEQRSQSTGIHLVESAATTEAIVLREARADYEIKLIAPGKGSSAFYPAEVLQRDGPQVFRAGTHVYLNHPTAAEEQARPEGDVANLAGVLTTDAVYHESHAKGPGLFARMKVFADHAQMVEEKAPHVGMSIRASGDAVMEGKRPKLQDGVPVLARLTGAESVDVVTRAGAGGMILTEAARSAESSNQEVSVDQTALEKLQQQIAVQEAQNKRLLERALRVDAREEGARILESVALPAQAKLKVIETCVRDIPVTTDGVLDAAKFKASIEAEAKSMGAFLASIGGGGQVRGLGVSALPEDPAKLREAQQREAEDSKLALSEAENVFARLMGDKEAAKNAARKGMAA